MLDAALKTQLQGYLDHVKLPFEIIASLDNSANANEMRALLEDIAGMCDKITLRTDGVDTRTPSFLLRRTVTEQSLRFAAIPLGLDPRRVRRGRRDHRALQADHHRGRRWREGRPGSV